MRLIGLLLTSALAVAVVVVVAQNSADDDSVDGSWNAGGLCERCSTTDYSALHTLPQSDIVRLHIERIKRQLLRKLGLSAVPNVTGIPVPSIHSLPPSLLSSHPVGNLHDDVTEGVFPDAEEGLHGQLAATAMSDDVATGSQLHDNDYYSYDDDADADAVFEEEFDMDDHHFAAGAPEPPPRTKQIFVFGQLRMSFICIC